MSLHEIARLWYRALQPSKIDGVIKDHKGKASLKEAMLNVFIASLVLGVALVFATVFGLVIFELIWRIFTSFGGVSDNPTINYMAGLQVEFVAASLGASFAVLEVPLFPIVFLLIQALQYGLARAFGGKGSFAQQVYFMGLVFGAVVTSSILIIIPCAGLLVFVVVAITGQYTNYRIIRKIHSLSANAAAAVTLISLFIALTLYILFWNAVVNVFLALINLIVAYFS